VFTLSVCIAALVAGAPFLDDPAKGFALALADFWHANVETWTSISGTPMAGRLGIDAYFIRLAPSDVLSDPSALLRNLELRNSEPGRSVPADEEVSVDFLELVRLGLRRADDPMIRASLVVADSLLKEDTPNGPAWRRYTGDGYGEHDDGRPYDGTGTGRAWPLLTGERGHYEVAAGRDPMPYLKAMAAMTGPGGMMPEQVWDAEALPERWLFPGKPTGSAMPLAWTNAEFIKLMVSRHLGQPVDRPAAVWERYGGRRPDPKRVIWCLHARIGLMARGAALVLALPRAVVARWGTDGWQNVTDIESEDSGLGLHTVTLDAAAYGKAQRIDFTFQDIETRAWVGSDFQIAVANLD
jgi:glucoamylase